MAGDEVGVIDQVGRTDRLRAETQVRHGDRARLLGVVHEVALGPEVSALTDDLHRRLVRADRAVRPQAEKDRLHLVARTWVAEGVIDGEAQIGDVVVDADSEVALRSSFGQLVEDRLDHRRRHLLGRQAVAPADHSWRLLERRRVRVHRLGEGRDDLQVERLTHRARLLGAIEHRDRPNGRRQRGDQLRGRERVEQPQAQQPDVVAGGVEGVDRLLNRSGGRPHHDDCSVGIGGAVVVDQAVVPAGAGLQLVHDLLDDARYGEVEGVARLPRLEEHVRVLSGAAHHGKLWRHAPRPVLDDVVVADQCPEVVVVENGDLVDLVGGAEPVEEVKERHPRPQRRRVRHEREVVRLLHRARGKHGPPCGPGVHHIAVVPEDRQRMGGNGSRRDVDHCRRQLTGDLEHVRDHQQQTLRRGERRCQRALLQGAVQRARGARLGLHLHHVGDQSPQVGAAGRGPVIRVLGHRRRRGDRVDRDHLTQRVRHPGRRLVAVHARPSLRHQVVSHGSRISSRRARARASRARATRA